MKWNNTTDLAIRGMVYLTNELRVVSSTEIAQQLSVSQQAVIQNAGPLMTVGFIGVVSGGHGGYFLAKDPSEITLYEIIVTMESAQLFPISSPKTDSTRIVDGIYHILQLACDNFFKSITIADLSRFSSNTESKIKKRALNGVIAGLADMQTEKVKSCCDNIKV